MKKELCPVCAGCTIDGKAVNTTIPTLSMGKLYSPIEILTLKCGPIRDPAYRVVILVRGDFLKILYFQTFHRKIK